jgi:hypothetical protein
MLKIDTISDEELITELLRRMSQSGGETISIVELEDDEGYRATLITTAPYSVVADAPCDECGYFDLMDEGVSDTFAIKQILHNQEYFAEFIQLDSVTI